MKRMLALLVLCLALPLVAVQLSPADLPAVWSAGERPTAWAKDEVYVLEFWATWCGPCREAMPHMEAIWQAGKDEGIHIIGVNTGEKRTAEQITTFLANQPTPPTYPIALDREEGLATKLKVNGIPHTLVLMNGEEVWKGHPGNLSIEALRILRKTGKMPEGEMLKAQAVDNPYQTMMDYERAADEAAEKGDWINAISLQRQALLSHPLQSHLEKLFLPAIFPRFNTHILSQAPRTVFSDELQMELPMDDDTLTVVALWKYPWWAKQITQENIQLLPGVPEVNTFTAKYRSITITKRESQEKTRELLRRVGSLHTEMHYAETINEEAFKVDDKYKYPFVKVYLDGTCLYTGALEAMPKALRGPLLTIEGYKKAFAEEDAHKERSKELYLALREGALEPALEAQLTTGYASLAMPYFFAEAYQKGDVQTGIARLNKVMQTYRDDPGALETILKLLDTWPELSEATPLQQETIALALAEHNPRIAPGYAVGYYLRASQCALKQNAKDRSQEYIRRALGICAQAKRLDDFQRWIRPLSAD